MTLEGVDVRFIVCVFAVAVEDLVVHPEQDIKYVIVDDGKTSREGVVLAYEKIQSYDVSYYETQLVRAVESVLSPIGWDWTETRR